MRDFLKVVLVTQFLMLIVVIFDVPVARQVVGFLYLSFIPGFLILGILGLSLAEKTNTITFSVGLSIAFIMLTGLIMNELYPLFGVSDPLSLVPLSITVFALVLAMVFVNYLKDSFRNSFSFSSVRQALRVFPVLFIPFLAIFGAMLASRLLLFLMVISIVVLVIATIFSRRLVQSELHVVVVLVIALSLLFQTPFISGHLVGFDIFGEYYVFRSTAASSLWNTSLLVPDNLLVDYNGMLSITILPAVYSNLLNINGELLFQFVYLLFYALVPLAMYQMYKQPFGKPVAILSAFYFALFPRFYMEERRQIVGELFLVLLISLIISRDMNPRKRRILLVVFGAALVASHYSISYIFLFSILSAWVITTIVGKRQLAKSDTKRVKVVDFSFLLLILVLNISWYFFITPSLGNRFVEFAYHLVGSFTTGFASVQSRGEMVSDFIAPDLSTATWVYKMDYVINKIPYFLIVIGLIGLARKSRHLSLEFEYLPMVFANVSILLMVLAVPAFAPAFLATRFYHVSLMFLAPICIFGGLIFMEWIQKPLRNIRLTRSVHLRVVCSFFIVIFLLKVGLVSEVTGDQATNISISYTRMKTSQNPRILNSFYESYVPEQDIYGAVWLSDVKGHDSDIYADEIAEKHVLIPYGMIVTEWNYILRNNTMIDTDAFVYLRYFNLDGNITEHERPVSATEVLHQLGWANKVYSNGGSEVYRSLPSG